MTIFKKFIDDWKASLQKDKTQHFILGAMVGLSSLSSFFIGYSMFFISITLVTFVGYGIELYQSFLKDRFTESNDAYATIAGGTLSTLLIWSVYLLIK